MKYLYYSLVFLFFFPNAINSQAFEVETLLNNGSKDERINIVFVGDGYQEAELEQYINDVQDVIDDLFLETPFKEYKNYFNVFAIKVPSNESGADHPATANDEGNTPPPISVVDSYFNSTFDVSGIHRLLVADNGIVNNVMFNNLPEYDIKFVLVNSNIYGGSGGSNAVSSTHPSASEISIHEIGHSFGLLGDEYFFSCSERANRTQEDNSALIRWNKWLPENDIDIYQISSSSCYRPHQSCKMRFLGNPFCAVCREAFVEQIHELTNPITSFSPITQNLTESDLNQSFSIDIIETISSNEALAAIEIEWTLNGVPFASGVKNVNLNANDLTESENTLTVTVTDKTSLTRDEEEHLFHVYAVDWTITRQTLPLPTVVFRAKDVEQGTLLKWSVKQEEMLDYFILERSDDGILFQSLATIPVINKRKHSTYEQLDPHPLYGATYYRLAQYDKNGAVEYSPIITLNAIQEFKYSIFPNPVDDQLFVELNLKKDSPITMVISDLSGKVILQKTTLLTAGSQIATLNVGHLAKGAYLLKMKWDGQFLVDRFVVK